jgi:hypothetical protein
MGKILTIIALCFSLIVPVHGQATTSLPVEEYSLGGFENAVRVSVAAQGTISVLDADQNKVFLFSGGAQSPKSIGGYGWSAGSFDKPTGIATDGINIYVADYGNHRIQRFDRNLNYLSSFSTRDTSETAARFGYPLDIALSELGDLFVLDGENLRVLKFNPRNIFERSFGTINSGNGKLYNPLKLIASTSQIVVCEQSRLVVFDYFGNYMRSIGEASVSGLTGFTMCGNVFLLASPDTLWLFSQEGVLQQMIPRHHLLTGESMERIQDVAWFGQRLFILSPHRLFIFKLVQ